MLDNKLSFFVFCFFLVMEGRKSILSLPPPPPPFRPHLIEKLKAYHTHTHTILSVQCVEIWVGVVLYLFGK